MCGILGFMDHRSSDIPNLSLLQESSRLLAHRGPDGQGVSSGPSIGLVHTRLAIVDLDPRSNQPFADRSGRFTLVYNGEIYNYRKLRDGLERRGVPFRTTGDTEVLLETLLNCADIESALRSLEGMFAFALYDRKKKSLLLARDRIGMKPLYYYEDDSRFVFSSEIQPMRPWIPWKADRAMLFSYLNGFRPITEGFNLFEGVQSLRPGSYLKVKKGSRAETGTFFRLSDFWDEDERRELARLRPEEAVDHVEEKLKASIRMQLHADAPVGAFCSGGVDSSLVASIAGKMHPGLTVFHCNIAGKCSEYEAAKALAAHLGSEFIVVDFEDEDYLERIPETVERAEYPYRHLSNAAPFLMLSEAARERGVKALLTGEASDEAFLGYPHYAPNILSALRRSLLLPDRAYRFFKKAAGLSAESRVLPDGFLEQFHQQFRTCLEKEEIRAAVAEKTGGRLKPRDIASLNDFSDNIRSLTHRNDSMGMAAGIETRFPFLDSEVIRSGINLPLKYKLRADAATLDRRHPFVRDKWVIRRLADRYVPRSLSRRTKIPFPTTFLDRTEIDPRFFAGGPLAEWLRWSDREFRYAVEHGSKQLKNALMYLEVWAHVCFYGYSKEEVRKKIKDHVRVRPEKTDRPGRGFFKRRAPAAAPPLAASGVSGF